MLGPTESATAIPLEAATIQNNNGLKTFITHPYLYLRALRAALERKSYTCIIDRALNPLGCGLEESTFDDTRAPHLKCNHEGQLLADQRQMTP